MEKGKIYMEKYISLKAKNYIKLQPDGKFFSLIIKNIRTEVGINDSAFEIIKQLSGEHRKSDIINNLASHFNESKDKVQKIVNDFLPSLGSGNLLSYSETPIKNPIEIKGSEEYFVPELVVLELTHKCPLKCKHCFVDAGSGPSMNKAKLLEILQQFINLGVQCIQLTGGEPFVYQYIEDVIDFLLLNGIRIQITTSGFIWNKRVERILEKLKGTGALIQISLDGFSESHNSIRGDSEAYTKAIKFINHCITRDITTVVATCVIDQELEEIEQLCIYLKKLGVSLHRIGGVSNQGRATINKISSKLAFDNINLFIDYLSSKYRGSDFQVGGFEDIDCHSEVNCGAGFRILKVSPSFLLSPCPMMDLNIGNLNNEKMIEIFKRNSKIFAKLSRPFDNICFNCKYLENCKNCIAEAFNNRKTVEKCHWFENEFKILEEDIYASKKNSIYF